MAIDQQRFGQFVAALRKEKGWTQKQLAARIGVSDKAVSKWERALSLPDISLLEPLAAALGVTVAELLHGERLAAPLEPQQVEALVTGAVQLGQHGFHSDPLRRLRWLGVLAAGVLTQDLSAYGNSIDNIIPQAIVQTLPPWLAGIAIIGPIAASISTVSSLLIASSSAIIKDLWLHHAAQKGTVVTEQAVSRSSQIITLVIGAIVFVLSIVPPDVIWKINMFAFGGLETASCWVFLGALFWKRANKTGALLSMAGGVATYCICMAAGITFFGMHQIVIGITVSFVLMVIGSLAGKPSEPDALESFFPEEEKPAKAA